MQVSCGEAHVSCLLEDGTVWAWGCAANRRFGSSSSLDVCVPTKMTVFDEHKVCEAVLPLAFVLIFSLQPFVFVACGATYTYLKIRILYWNEILTFLNLSQTDSPDICCNTKWTDSYS